MDLGAYDAVLVNSSAGKDSQAMLDVVAELAAAQGVRERVTVVHADLGRVEWPGTRELAERQAKHYGFRFEAVQRPQGDLLDQVLVVRHWPRNGTRYCTSDQKRDQVKKLITRIVAERHLGRPVRVLQCLGLRAAESPTRAKLQPLTRDERASNSKRTVELWLPLHSWTVDQVWARVRASGVPHHPAYDLGMPRLSCCFCVFSSRPALLLAGQHNPALLAEYVRVEKAIGHTFRKDQPIAEIAEALARGEQPGPITTWEA